MVADPAGTFPIALAHHQAGRFAEAERLYREILTVVPNYVPILNNLGLLAGPDEALELFQRAVALWPDYVDAQQNLGNAYQMRDQFDRAAVCYEQALRFRPGDPDLLFNLGKARCRQGLNQEGAACFRQALAGRPDDSNLLFNLSVVQSVLGDMAAATASCQRALMLAPNVPATALHFANLMRVQDRFGDAIKAYERLLSLTPDCVDAIFYLGLILHSFNRFEEAIRQFEHVVALQPDRADVYDSMLMTLSYLPDCSIERLLAAHRRYDRLYAPPVPPPPPARAREPERRLRVGYVSDELFEPFANYFVEPLFRAHDRREIEVFCYSGGERVDAATERLKTLCDVWRDTTGIGDGELVGAVRGDAIDILVDLSGHAAPNRLRAFAQRPAPVQVTWLGYPATTGLAAMDYRLVDAVTDPEGEGDRAASEVLIRLPEGFLCFQPPRAPDIRDTPFMEEGRVRFGCLNNFSKVSAPGIGLWAELLRRLPAATLTLKDKRLHCDDIRRQVEADFAGYGVAPDRLELLGWIADRQGHLEAFRSLDIALDPFPYNGTTITCETLWMGVPVVTLLGDRHAARVGAGLLTRIGLEELVARDEETYLQIAVALASDTDRLGRLRRGMRERMLASPLCDAGKFAYHIERAYRYMWRRWCGGEKAGAFSV